jgi:hypothetical protein
VGDTKDLTRLLGAIANLDHNAAVDLLNATPLLATASLARPDEFFLAERLAQLYEGDTALHAAGFSYDPDMARDLITRGADIRARNWRGAEPLHTAVIGVPGSASWNPACQRDVILYLWPPAGCRRRGDVAADGRHHHGSPRSRTGTTFRRQAVLRSAGARAGAPDPNLSLYWFFA